jgi:hypothetical protein
MRNVKILPILLSMLLIVPAFGQSRRQARGDSSSQTTTNAQYYFDITRPNCCALTGREWQNVAARLKAKGIPAFFGLYEVLDYREEWNPVRLRKTVAREGWLMLGPFASPEKALQALFRLPLLLPKKGDTFRGVEEGPTGDKQSWRVGLYQIQGFKTRLSVTVQKARILQAGMLEGVVVERTFGASWLGIIVEANGVKYLIQLGGNSGGVGSIVGDVQTVGNRVRVTYRDKQCESSGECSLDATRVVQIRKK